MYLTHPFIRGIKDGSLDIAKFRRFMLEDYLYLFEYVKVFAIGLSKTKDFDLMKMFAESIDAILNHEMDIHRSYMKRIGIRDEEVQDFKASLINTSYTSYMLSVSQAGDVIDTVSAVLACSWSYAEIGDYIASDENALNNEFYGQWVQGYSSKKELINEINKRAKLFIDEFKEIKDENRDTFVKEVDRSPAQMIAYQLGWMNLIFLWEEKNKNDETVITPSENYKWNNLGGLYQSFYKKYENYSIKKLITEFNITVKKITDLIEVYTEKELFEQNQRQWASSTPSNWPIWKWIHINTVAPFKTFRIKIRKWKRIKN